MKTRNWVIALSLVLAVCLVLSFVLMMPREDARWAEIYSRGQLLRTVDLLLDQEFTVETPGGDRNVVTVKDGKIAVTEASCPDHYCMERGFCSGGTQIVCLPNQLVIEFIGEQAVDAVVG